VSSESPLPAASETPLGGATPRTPRSVEVSVEGQEVAVPVGAWSQSSDGQFEVAIPRAVCTVTVKAGLTGRSGMNVVLRVGLTVHDNVVRFKATPESLGGWTALRVDGAEECDIGRLPCRSDGSPRLPRPGVCPHDWCEFQGEASGSAEEVLPQEALVLGPSACRAEFYRSLALHVHATCLAREDGQGALRVEVSGELRLRPRFRLVGHEGVRRLHAVAMAHASANEDLQALQKCEEALAMADGLRPWPQETANVLCLMGALHLRRGTTTISVKCLERGLAIFAQSACPDELAMAGALGALGNAHQACGSHGEALRCHERAYEIVERMAGPEDAATASALHSLGGSHRLLGNQGEARRFFQRALVARRQTLGPEHPLLASTLNNLGAVLQQLSEEREAIRCYQESLAIEEKVYGSEHPATAATLSNLGSAHGRLGEHQCATDCHERALATQEKVLGSEHPNVAATLHNLGNALAAGGRGRDAARCHWRALAVWSKVVGPAHPDVAATLHCLGNVYRGLREPEAAAKCFAGALRIREACLGPTHPETARTRHCAALVGCSLGDPAVALQELLTAAKSLSSSLGSAHPWSLQARVDAESLRQAAAI